MFKPPQPRWEMLLYRRRILSTCSFFRNILFKTPQVWSSHELEYVHPSLFDNRSHASLSRRLELSRGAQFDINITIGGYVPEHAPRGARLVDFASFSALARSSLEPHWHRCRSLSITDKQKEAENAISADVFGSVPLMALQHLHLSYLGQRAPDPDFPSLFQILRSVPGDASLRALVLECRQGTFGDDAIASLTAHPALGCLTALSFGEHAGIQLSSLFELLAHLPTLQHFHWGGRPISPSTVNNPPASSRTLHMPNLVSIYLSTGTAVFLSSLDAPRLEQARIRSSRLNEGTTFICNAHASQFPALRRLSYPTNSPDFDLLPRFIRGHVHLKELVLNGPSSSLQLQVILASVSIAQTKAGIPRAARGITLQLRFEQSDLSQEEAPVTAEYIADAFKSLPQLKLAFDCPEDESISDALNGELIKRGLLEGVQYTWDDFGLGYEWPAPFAGWHNAP